MSNLSITLFRVIEAPSRTLPIDSSPFESEIETAKSKMSDLDKWLSSQNYNVNLKINVSRNAAEGIIEEANSGGYSLIIMMKRTIKSRFQKLVRRSMTEEVIRYARCMVLSFIIDERRALEV